MFVGRMEKENRENDEINYKALATILNIAAIIFAVGLIGVAVAENNWLMGIPAVAMLVCHALLVRESKNSKKK